MKAVAVVVIFGLLTWGEATQGEAGDAPAKGSAPAAVQVQPWADYDRCIATAGGTDPKMVACTDEEILWTQAVLTRTLTAAGRTREQVTAAQSAFEAGLPFLSGALLAPPSG